MSPTIYSTNFDATLQTAMNDFHEALTKRWREEYVEKAIRDRSHDYPIAIRRATSPTEQQLWDVEHPAAQHHFVFGECGYLDWVDGGQEGELSSVTCSGETGTRESRGEPPEIVDHRTGEMVEIPETIECGLGANLEAVESWAWGERDTVYHVLPLFDAHDLRALKRAHESLVDIGEKLGLEASDDSEIVLSPMGSRDLTEKIEGVSAERAEGQDFWAGWTGLAASRAKAGFFSSVGPTYNNQSGIAGSLANLYSARASIIQKARNNTLYAIQQATKALDEKTEVTTDLRPAWDAVSGTGAALGVVSAWTGVGAAAGATVGLVGFLGSTLFPEQTTIEYTHTLEEVVNGINDDIDDLDKDISREENEYGSKVSELERLIYEIDSFNLELYDLTKNSPDGNNEGDEGGYEAVIEDIMRLGEYCYDIGDAYNQLIAEVAHTSDGDVHLADKDGEPTTGDIKLLEIRDQFEGFLTTSTGRYIMAGDQVKAAAEAYVRQEGEEEAAFARIMSDWEEEGVGDVGVDNPEYMAEETDRSGSDPYQDHPARGGGEPPSGGTIGDDEYVTEEDE